MADITGTIRESIGGKTYELRLTMLGIGKLQEKYGNSVAGLLDGTQGDIPNFRALVDLIAIALVKGGGVSEQDAEEIADSMLSNDTEIVGRIIAAAFPAVTVGKPRKPQKVA